MKTKYILAIFCLIGAFCSFGQSNIETLIQGFKSTNDDSAFVSTYSKRPFERFVAQRYLMTDVFDVTDSVMFFHGNQGEILGPYESDSFLIFVKVISVDSLLRMRVGNIYLNPEKRGKDKIDKLSRDLLASIKKDKNFDVVCKTYADDNNKNKDCDLGWFFQGIMVSEFEEEVLKHQKDECFIVTTRFGNHLVKILDNPVLDRSKVEYTFLFLYKQ